MIRVTGTLFCVQEHLNFHLCDESFQIIIANDFCSLDTNYLTGKRDASQAEMEAEEDDEVSQILSTALSQDIILYIFLRYSVICMYCAFIFNFPLLATVRSPIKSLCASFSSC